MKKVNLAQGPHLAFQIEKPEETKVLTQADLFLFSVGNEQERELFTAVLEHDVHGLRKSLNINVDVNARNNELKTPLHIASENGDLTIVHELLKWKMIKVNLPDMNGNTPLHIATFYSWLKVVNVLLINGASPNVASSHGETPLHIAISQENIKIAHNLLRFGAQIDIKNCFGDTPLHIAVDLQNINLVRLLFRYTKTLTKKDHSYSFLSQLVLSARKGKHVELLKLILSHGANINAFDKISKLTILHLAAMRGERILVKLIMDEGGDLYAKDAISNIPLKTAICFENWESARIIIHAMEESEILITKK